MGPIGRFSGPDSAHGPPVDDPCYKVSVGSKFQGARDKEDKEENSVQQQLLHRNLFSDLEREERAGANQLSAHRPGENILLTEVCRG